MLARSRFICTDWHGTRHNSHWVETAPGSRHWQTVQDLTALRVEVEFHTLVS